MKKIYKLLLYKMSFTQIFLISVGSAVIVSLLQDGLKILVNRIKVKSDCKCCKINYNEYKSQVELKKK